MSSTTFRQSLRRLWALDKFSYSVRVFIALTGSMALCWYQDEMGLLIPLFLGIIASALAETDDSWQGRLNALAVTLVCFYGRRPVRRTALPLPRPLYHRLCTGQLFA